MKHYQAYLIDLDGTMYKGTDEIDGAAQFIDYLNNNHIPHLYVTNNSTKTPVQVTEKLREMHIDAKPDEVVTSALATADYISEQHPNATVYMIGGHGLKTALTDAGLSIKNDEHVDYVVIGLDEKVTYEKLSIATLAVPVASLMIQTDILARFTNTFFAHRIDAKIEQMDYKGIERYYIAGIIPWALSRMIPVFLALAFGGSVVKTVVNYLNSDLKWLGDGLTTAGAVLPAVGFAILLRYLPIKKHYMYFILGFVLTALLAGSFGYIVVEILQQKLHAQFIPEFMGALVIGLVTIIGHNLIPGGSISTIIIAAVMPIVPGVLITNAIQDLFGGHMLMFTTKSLESLVTAFGIGAGVSTVLIIF